MKLRNKILLMIALPLLILFGFLTFTYLLIKPGYIILSFGLGSVACALIIYLLLELSVVSPLLRLIKDALKIKKSGDFTARLAIKGKNEISSLSQTINALLATLELHSQELENTYTVHHRLEQTQGILEIIRGFSGIRDTQDLLNKATELIQTRINLYHVSIFLIDEQKEFALLSAAAGDIGKQLLDQGQKFSLNGATIIAQAAINHKPYRIVERSGSALRFDSALLPLTRTELALPLLIGKQLLGVLVLYSSRENDFDPGELVTLNWVADSLAAALDNANQFKQLLSSLDEISSLHRQYLKQTWAMTSQLSGELNYSYENEPQQLLKAAAESNQIDLPISLREQVIGHISLEIDKATLTPQELGLVEAITTEAAIALENTRLLQETQTRAERERLLTQISSKVRASSDVNTILQNAILELGKATKATEGLIQLHIPEESAQDTHV